MAAGESKFDTYSSDDLTNYAVRLHFNTAVCLVFTVLAIYCILFHSTKGMGVYKWYLLAIQLTTALFDFHLSFIAAPFPTFPIPGVCAAGIWSRQWGYIWGQIVQFMLLHWFLCFQGMAIIYGIVYRYRVLSEKMEWMNTIWAKILIVVIPFIYPIPAATLILASVPDRNTTFAFVKQEAPELLDLFLTEPCNSLTYSTTLSLYYLTAGIQILIGFGAIIFYSYKTYVELMKKRPSMSETTFRLHKQLLVALFLQCVVPFIFLVIPSITLYVMMLLNVRKMKVASLIGIQIIAIHSTGNAILMIVMIKPYRQAVINLLRCRTKTPVNPFLQKIHITRSSHITAIEVVN